MKTSEIYIMVCRAFAVSFAFAPTKKLFDEIKKNPKWILQSESEANKLGNDLYKDALNREDVRFIKDDFELLKKYFAASFFFKNEGEILTKLYTKCGFLPNLNSSYIDSLTNEFSFLAALFNLPANKERNETIAIFLGIHLLPLIDRLAEILQNKAKSSYYKAFGYFLKDFSQNFELNFKIKAIKR